MSMIGNLLRVTELELDEYMIDSSLLEANIYKEETDEGNPNLINIGKAWYGIIFLLTGQKISDDNHPLVQVLFSGQIIDEEQNLGYGPAHYLTPTQVADLNSQIEKITSNDLKEKYNPPKMMQLDIYPTIWNEGDEAFNYLNKHFMSMKQIYSEATKNGEAIITFIN